jgi:hypothetical protein
MKKSPAPPSALQKEYQRLRQSLAQTGYLSQGSVLDRSQLRPPRFGYQWTRKVRGKTVTVALSEAEFKALGQAIANQRKLNQTLRKMEQISRRILFSNRPKGDLRKTLRQRLLGLI